MKSENALLMRLAKRAEKLKTEHLVKSFVDVGPTYTLLSSYDNQIMFGRRGTGKTHFLSVLHNEITTQKTISVKIDMRLIGSTGGIFSDPNISRSERATRLLVDTLQNIHESILDFLWDNNIENVSEITPILDEFLEQASAITIEGVAEREVSQSNQNEESSNKSIGLKIKDFSASVSDSHKQSSTISSKGKKTGKQLHRVHFSTITKLLNKVVSLLPNNELWVLIDEWSETPIDLQPYLAELLRRVLYPVSGITVKIAAIAHRCNFREHDIENKLAIGIELGADASSVINLDEYMVFDNDNCAAQEFFENLLFKHIKAIDSQSIFSDDPALFINEVFSQKSAFNEFVRASEGVPRDAINIISIAAQKASKNKISIACIREASQLWFHRTKHNALNSRPCAVTLLDWIVHEVIGLRKSRGFLLSNEKKDDLVDYLYDARVIHVLKQGVSAQNSVGKKYTLYALDYGCYVDLMSSRDAPKGLIIESDLPNGSNDYIEIPKTDYRSIKNSILDLEKYYNQGRLPLFTSTELLQLPEKQKKTKVSIGKTININIINSLPKGLGNVKISGTTYIPMIIASLVLRKAQGFEKSNATELTKIINEYITVNTARTKVTSNNLSRELRKESILELEWLRFEKQGRITLFFLSDNWNIFWQQYFEKEAPLV